MRKLNHSPAYVLQIRSRWRVVVPVRGKLTPRICPEKFPTRSSAEAWLNSDEGTCMVEVQRRGGLERRTSSEGSQISAAIG
jgi:hypothetical protein